jgi:hypothetical protein
MQGNRRPLSGRPLAGRPLSGRPFGVPIGNMGRRRRSLAAQLLAPFSQGLAFSFVDMSAVVRDTTTPANNFSGNANDLLTYTSPSIKWIRNSTGVYVSGTTLRTEYDSSGALGLRIEEARTNLLLNSAFAGGVSGAPGTAPTSWGFSSSGGSYIAGAAGLLSGETRYGVACSSGARHYSSQIVTLAASSTYTVTVLYELTGTSNLNNVATQNPAPTGSSVTWTVDGVTQNPSSALPEGRHILVGTVSSGDGGNFGLRLGLGTSSNLGADAEVYFDYAQIELGASSTSPIVTAGATVTRAADDIRIAQADFPYNAGSGDLEIDGVSDTISTDGTDVSIVPRSGETHIESYLWVPS